VSEQLWKMLRVLLENHINVYVSHHGGT